MSFRDYLHEKAEESRHNEMISYLMFIAGAIFFVGGTLETLSLAAEPEWFLFIPYHIEPHAGAVLGLSLIISGLCLIVFGLAAGINYSRDRSWYMQELRKANSIEELMMSKRTTVKKQGKKKFREIKNKT
ncbi:hypothetical protein DRO44_00865 [Candidatus Bathyarchaeota archaeon]|nr:MAG: hypothetical protein DRO44_00865 [Candidatus Bathyarchaeota archaeon]